MTQPASPQRAFATSFPIVELPAKPRTIGQTEIRDAAMGMHQLGDLVSMMGEQIDSVKWTCGTQRLVDRDLVKRKNSFLQEHQIDVSTGGILERVVLHGDEAVHRFLDECNELSFAIVEVSSGLAILSLQSKIRLIRAVSAAGLRPKPEVAMTYGMGEQSTPADADYLIREIDACLAAGADKIMIEEEGIFRYVEQFRASVVHKMVRAAGIEHLMFEASDRATITWLLANYGPDVNLFIDPKDLPYLAAYRAGIWGNSDIWARMATFGGSDG